MSDTKGSTEAPKGQFDADGNYILEDTGETLQDFDPEKLAAQIGAAAQSRHSNETGEGDAALRLENEALRDQYVRKLADFENFRKRTEREKSEYYKYALADMMRELLTVLDNLERALTHAEGGGEFHRGVELIHKQLLETLQKNGLRVVADTDVPFDPQIHEAVMREERTDVPSHTVIDLLQKGYFLHDRLLRPAMVKVAVGGPERPTGSDSQDS